MILRTTWETNGVWHEPPWFRPTNPWETAQRLYAEGRLAALTPRQRRRKRRKLRRRGIFT